MQSYKYAMVTPSKCNAESRGFRDIVNFLGP